jgi:DNA-binding MarR family transcriptional regulator
MPNSNFPFPTPTALDGLIMEVRALHHALTRRHPNRATNFELTPTQLSILQLLDHHGSMTVPQIARRRLTSRQSVQVAATALKRVGAITLIPNLEHKRSSLLHLTSDGKARLAAAARNSAARPWQPTEAISPERVEEATSVLRQIRLSLTTIHGGPVSARPQSYENQVPTKSNTASSESTRSANPIDTSNPANADNVMDRAQDPLEMGTGELPLNLL